MAPPPSTPPSDAPLHDDGLPSYSSLNFVAVPVADDGEKTVPEQQAEGPGADPQEWEDYGKLNLSEGGMNTQAQVAEDGRINIKINQRTRRFSDLLAPALHSQWAAAAASTEDANAAPPRYQIPEFATKTTGLNILIQIIGSRGDVQPFIALGRELKDKHKHRVRLATHPTFKNFVEENGLEFFSLGGDPAELMAFMVKNPGLVPGMDSLRDGDVTRRRKEMWEMLLGGWRACIEPGDGMGYQPALVPGARGPPGRPFVADAIIANPPSFGHIHCAERLGVPLHLMFTMPWSPTSAFPHPLANIQSSDIESSLTNFLSYVLVDMMTWQGLGDLVNKFRRKTLGLEELSTMWAPGMISRLKVPHTYCWSPTLIPKPFDWSSQINISGFYFLSLATSYTPPPELLHFLESGPPPVYIGFGSIVVPDPDALTRIIFEAVRQTGCRALVSQGWGGLGADTNADPNILLLGNCPHDWLFPRCVAVVHHGGAGTTAAGIRCGKPTAIVPFFGDQPFWGSMIHKAGAGPEPIPYKQLTAEKLAAAITIACSREVQAKAEVMGDGIRAENGAEDGALAFLSSLKDSGLTHCDILKGHVAVWLVKGKGVKLSAMAAAVLLDAGMIEGGLGGLKLWRHKEWQTEQGPLEPLTGGAGALIGTIGSIMMGVGEFPKELFKGISKREGKGKAVEDGATPPRASSELSVNRVSTSSVSSTSTEKPKTSSIDLGTAVKAGDGIKRIVTAGLRSPMDFTLGIAQGFRNAPKLYGDNTVRPEARVTGIRSGLRTAGKEFSLGFYDGITGVVTQPLKGAKEEGAAGMIKGFGRGAFGLILKPGAGIWALPGYAMKGLHAEIMKMGTKDVGGYVSAARVAQGAYELHEAPEMKAYIVGRWKELSEGSKAGGTWWKGKDDKQDIVVDVRDYDDDHKNLEDEELMRAINESLKDTRRNQYDEDSAIRQAMQESIASSSTTGPPPEEEFSYKIQMSPPEYSDEKIVVGTSDPSHDDDELEIAIQESLRLEAESHAERTRKEAAEMEVLMRAIGAQEEEEARFKRSG